MGLANLSYHHNSGSRQWSYKARLFNPMLEYLICLTVIVTVTSPMIIGETASLILHLMLIRINILLPTGYQLM